MKASSIIMQEKIYLSPRQSYGRDYGSRLMGNILSAPSRFERERRSSGLLCHDKWLTGYFVLWGRET